MKAMPLLGGNAAKNFLHASRPPADAPIPTTVMSFVRATVSFVLPAADEPFNGDCGGAVPARGGRRPGIFDCSQMAASLLEAESCHSTGALPAVAKDVLSNFYGKAFAEVSRDPVGSGRGAACLGDPVALVVTRRAG